ncbi:PREDICTED: tumor necrosis factor receptor superfamily member 4 [Gavialis gangeticus]|uniref:tumor necrosis factor receptor superfamily member 4 n=1 Tax=Gavialis gangeticus TaxID=94835 RepID=UPI00092EBD2A|nr:PREDICTED: tumor necrosis factor receptor superfamily member 4 [Gavialis gangeticus]
MAMARPGETLWALSCCTAGLPFLLLSLIPCPALTCTSHEYSLRGIKCCKMCGPGEEIQYRCTETTETVCKPCQDGYYKTEYSEGDCKTCKICNIKKGTTEVKKCDQTSDRVCMCTKGFEPSRFMADGTAPSACSACSAGSFSKGENSKCHPWTNCTASGRTILREGSDKEDVICGDQKKQATTIQSPVSTSHTSVTTHKNSTLLTALMTPRPKNTLSIPPIHWGDQPTVSTEPTNWGPLSLILICLTLLMVSGMSILLLIIQATGKGRKKKLQPAENDQRKGRSCRIPIQEEQIDSNSSLIKN